MSSPEIGTTGSRVKAHVAVWATRCRELVDAAHLAADRALLFGIYFDFTFHD